MIQSILDGEPIFEQNNIKQFSKSFPYMLYSNINIRLYRTIDAALIGYKKALQNNYSIILIRTEQYEESR